MPSYSLRENELDRLPIPLRPGMRIFLVGTLGSGKTALARHLLRERLGIEAPVKSPTYTYLARYRADGFDVCHFDLYRMEGDSTFVQAGGEDILDEADTLCLFEWPDLVRDRIRPDVEVRIGLDPEDPMRRVYHLSGSIFDDADLLKA